MKKFLLLSLSVIVHIVLILVLIWFYLTRTSSQIQNSTISSMRYFPVFEKCEIVPIQNNATSATKQEYNISSKIPKNISVLDIPIKEIDLIHVDFHKRLKALDAKLGDRVFIRIFKKESMLEVWIKPKDEYLLFKQYPICSYSGRLGPKLKEGDKQAPEGFYKVKKSQLNPNSSYHLSFNLGYPNRYDRLHKRTGSYLMVHGECVSIGCYAMTNVKIEEIYKLVERALKSGQKYVQVHAFPFYMTDKNMAKYSNNRWYDFWTELKEGYEYFETEKLPPNIKVKNRHYTIHEANE